MSITQHPVINGDAISAFKVEAWLASKAKGLSFVDIGGLGHQSGNERVSIAHAAGAKQLAMADILPPDHPWWTGFKEKLDAANIADVRCLTNFNLLSQESASELGKYDIVNSTGIMYHCPDMIGYLWRLREVTNRYAITSMVTIPHVIENEFGRFETPPSGCIFLPALNDEQRKIFAAHYTKKFPKMLPIDKISPPASTSVSYYVRNGQLSTSPNWWFITREALLAMIALAGFSVIEEYIFRDHASVLLLEVS